MKSPFVPRVVSRLRSSSGLAAFAVTLALSTSTTSRADEPPRAKTGIAKVLVLKNGRTVEGTINRNSAGYLVDKPTGSMVVPEDLVKFAAASRADAYQKMRESANLKTADGHVQLAEWCLNNGFHDEAAAELREALTVDPQRGDARRMLTRLEDIVQPDNARHRQVERTPPKTVDGFDAPEVRSIGNLSRDAALEFVSKVQPILMHKCGIAGCHGPSEQNRFRLERVVIGSNTHRLYSDRNLATVFRHIDTGHIEKSPLLVQPQGPHGKSGQPVFSGPGGAEQLDALCQWVTAVAQEKKTGQREEASQTPLMKDRSLPRNDDRGIELVGGSPVTPGLSPTRGDGQRIESKLSRIPGGAIAARFPGNKSSHSRDHVKTRLSDAMSQSAAPVSRPPDHRVDPASDLVVSRSVVSRSPDRDTGPTAGLTPHPGSTVLDSEARTRRELAEVRPLSSQGKEKATDESAAGRPAEIPDQKNSGDVLDRALREERPDAFDPGEFNARYHGAGRKRNALNGR